MNLPDYNPIFIEHYRRTGKPWQDPINNAAKYGLSVTVPAAQGDQSVYRIIGIHHLTGAENKGNHHAYCDVLDEQGKRVNGARIGIVNFGKPTGSAVIDKPANEAGTNIPMHSKDTLDLWVEGDYPSSIVIGLHTRHADEEPGTTWGHHSFYIVWQRMTKGSEPPIEPPDPPTDPEPPKPPAEGWREMFDERQLKEIDYCLLYDSDRFRHGTDGHNIRLIVAKFARWAEGKLK